MRPEDLAAFSTISDPQLHPDGIRIAFTVSKMDFDDDRYERSIWVWDGESARPFTHGPIDVRPRWSPDGDRLAFLRCSGEPGAQVQLAVIEADGGEARVITDFDRGVSEAEWAPDGSRLAVIASGWEGDEADLDDEERAKRPRRITKPAWRFDNVGYRHDRTAVVALVDPAGSTDPVVLTEDEHRDSGIAWRPDGTAIGFLSARHDRAGFDSSSQPWEVPVGGGDPVAMAAPGMWASISYGPSGDLFLVGLEDENEYPGVYGLYRVEAGMPVRLAADYDRNLLSPAPTVAPDGPQWLASGACRIVAEDRGTLVVIEIQPDGTWREIAGGRRMITGMTCRPDGSAMAMVSVGVTDPGELVWFEGGSETTLTSINADFRAEGGLVDPEHFVADADGVELDVWVFLPPGDDPVPVLFNIHGGPATQYGWGFFDEFQVYVDAGYGVVATNPRGSSGRGDEFVRAPVGHWHEERPVDLEDLMAAYRAAIDRFDRLDGDRAGIMGGSYGGLITVKILAVEHGFKSAVPERGLYNFVSFAGTSDIGFTFPGRYVPGWSYEDFGPLWDASPLKRAHRITTPCLVIHSDSDFRCPIEQGEQLFHLLLDNGVETEMLRFPGESHELSRSGTPVHRRQRFEAILDWHGRHLGVGE
jgi:dipeptidyl aminopeptidase/acylaminoacyl peptidase